MSSNIANSSPFLRTAKEFPTDINKLVLQINKSWVDIANAVNTRTISLFPTTRSAITGEEWFITSNQKQQTLRQVYTFNSAGTFDHNIQGGINNFARIWGTFTDGTFWYTLPYVDVVAANNQINVKVNSTQVTITAGAGTPPTIVSGILVLEWLSNP